MANPPIPPRRSDASRQDPTLPDKGGKSTAFALAGMVGIALLAILAIAITRNKPEGDADQFAFADKPSQSRIAECNQYAAQVARDSGPIGGGSASIRDDDPNLAGLSDENRFSDAARVAYRDCMLGIQHDS
jgi:hypothetical protein